MHSFVNGSSRNKQTASRGKGLPLLASSAGDGVSFIGTPSVSIIALMCYIMPIKQSTALGGSGLLEAGGG